MGAILVLLAAVAAGACDAGPRLAALGHAVCAIEPSTDGVRARRCGGDGNGGAHLMVHDGTSLWVGVSEHAACGVRPRGLVRYDLARGAAHAFRGTDAGPCGFGVHDLLLNEGALWVATDLGVSRLRVSSDDWDEWTHYALAPDGALEETACGALLMTVAEAAAAPGGEELGAWLAEFRPGFVRRLPRGMRNASWTDRRRDEQALGRVERSGTGRGAHVHPRPVLRPQAAPDGGS